MATYATLHEHKRDHLPVLQVTATIETIAIFLFSFLVYATLHYPLQTTEVYSYQILFFKELPSRRNLGKFEQDLGTLGFRLACKDLETIAMISGSYILSKRPSVAVIITSPSSKSILYS